MLARFPHGKKGKVSQMVQNIDYAPTFLELAGVDIPEDIQGVSLKPVLTNEGNELPIGGKLHIIITMSILPNIR